jgi:hypothetical protein
VEGDDGYYNTRIIPMKDIDRGKLYISFYDGGWSNRIYYFEMSITDPLSEQIWNYTRLPPGAFGHGPYAYHEIIDVDMSGEYTVTVLCDWFSSLGLRIRYVNDKGMASYCGFCCGIPMILSFGTIMILISWAKLRKFARKNLDID